MTPDDIRAAYLDAIAPAMVGHDRAVWESLPESSQWDYLRDAAPVVDALEAAGLLPRRVTTEAELDALPMHSIVRIGNYAYQSLGNGWFNSPADPTYSEAMLDMAEDEPVFVLWTPPTEGVQA
ncbi:hypothetical protein AB0H71_13900 [Nocardia sp. NPDC050697]|uniref:hypothetical protein n=1 Tax=Nocardia sp. NPDC050697 TaxID=3155158 RepID=UPI0033E4A063